MSFDKIQIILIQTIQLNLLHIKSLKFQLSCQRVKYAVKKGQIYYFIHGY